MWLIGTRLPKLFSEKWDNEKGSWVFTNAQEYKIVGSLREVFSIVSCVELSIVLLCVLFFVNRLLIHF